MFSLFCNDTPTTDIYTYSHTLSLHDALPIYGVLIDDPALAHYLGRVIDEADDIGASFFEVTTAAAFLAFSEHPADGCVIEVGLGGRLDATNVITAPAACGIAQLGIAHQELDRKSTRLNYSH